MSEYDRSSRGGGPATLCAMILGSLAACGGEASEQQMDPRSPLGSLQLPLTFDDATGSYRLEARIELEGPEARVLDTRDVLASDRVLQQALTPGAYVVELASFELLREVQGEYARVAAVLDGSVARNVSVAPGSVTPLTYRFVLDDGAGAEAGALAIDFEVATDPTPGHALIASDPGVALVSTPARTKLSQTLFVRDTLGRATPWSARSDQGWLSVTRGGSGGEGLELRAEIAGLELDRVHLATVFIETTTPSVERTDRVRVGLWVGSSAPEPTIELPLAQSVVVADPIRPLVYSHAGGASISSHNVHTGELVEQLVLGTGSAGPMAVSSDGSELFVADASGARVHRFELDTGRALPDWEGPTGVLAYTRCDGRGVLVAGNGLLVDALTGTPSPQRFDAGYYGRSVVAADRRGSAFCALDEGLSPYSLSCYELACPAGGGLALELRSASTGPGSNGRDVALSADGQLVYVAAGAPYRFDVFDASGAAIASLPGEAYPNNVEVLDDGRIVAGAGALYAEADTWVYAADGTPLGEFDATSGYATSLLTRQLTASGDGQRLIALTSDDRLEFFDID